MASTDGYADTAKNLPKNMIGNKRFRGDLLGNQSLEKLSQRDAHPLAFRKERVQLFFVAETGKTYHLVGGKTNAHFAEYKTLEEAINPFKIKRMPVAGEVYEHNGSIGSLFENAFAPYLTPTIALSVTPVLVELGLQQNISHSGSLDAKGETETVYSNLQIIKDNAVVVASAPSGNNLAFTELTVSSTVEKTVQYKFSADWSDGGTRGGNLVTVNRTVTFKAPYLAGLSLDSGLIASTIYAVLKASRTRLDGNIISFNLNTASGEHIYVVVPSAKPISAIADLNDNGAAVPLSTFTQVSQGSMNVNDVAVPYDLDVKVYRTGALGAANFNWRITLQ